MFKKLENNRPFLKMAFEGFAGDGKTYTATQVAIGLHKRIGSKKPIAIFDTEKASKALVGIFRDANIEAVVQDEQRSLSALNQAIKWCEDGGSDILLIDSITHVWEEFMQSYLNRPDKYGKSIQRTRLEFQDWGVIKPRWKAEFSNVFVQSKVHIIFTGRAGYEYSDEKNAETGKREIFKSGIKMKAETETAFEPDILVLMEKHLDLLGEKKKVTREATIIKDRTAAIDGKSFTNPTFEDFAPAIDILLSGTYKASDSVQMTDSFTDAEVNISENRNRKDKLIAEIEGAFTLCGFGAKVSDKQTKAAILNNIWKVTSTDSLTSERIESLENGLKILRLFSDNYLKYLENCAETQTETDPKQIKELLTNAKDGGEFGLG